MTPTKTFAALLYPYRTDVIANACGVSSETVRAWKNQESTPRGPAVINSLVSVLEIDAQRLLDVLTESQNSKAAA